MHAVWLETGRLRGNGDAYGSFNLLVNAAGRHARQALVEVQRVTGERVFYRKKFAILELEKLHIKIVEKRTSELEGSRAVAIVQSEVAVAVGIVEVQKQERVAPVGCEQTVKTAEAQARHLGEARLFRFAGKQDWQQPQKRINFEAHAVFHSGTFRTRCPQI